MPLSSFRTPNGASLLWIIPSLNHTSAVSYPHLHSCPSNGRVVLSLISLCFPSIFLSVTIRSVESCLKTFYPHLTACTDCSVFCTCHRTSSLPLWSVPLTCYMWKHTVLGIHVHALPVSHFPLINEFMEAENMQPSRSSLNTVNFLFTPRCFVITKLRRSSTEACSVALLDLIRWDNIIGARLTGRKHGDWWFRHTQWTSWIDINVHNGN